MSGKILVSFIALLLLISGCKKFVTVEAPAILTTGEGAYATDRNAIAVLNGLYSDMSDPGKDGITQFMSVFPGLSSDEFSLYSAAVFMASAYYRNELTVNDAPIPWQSAYSYINRINVAIEGLSKSSGLKDKVKSQLLGEAKFLRALHYFYLVNLYGPVPLVIGTEYKMNALLGRSPVEEVYAQMLKDLGEAQGELGETFVAADAVSPGGERVAPNRWTAKALLARVQLYAGRYQEAIGSATEVINQSGTFRLVGLDSVFLANSEEALWQLQPVNKGWNTEDARIFTVTATGPTDNYYGSIFVSDSLLNAFEAGDQRRTKWVGNITVDGVTYQFPYKYKSAKLDAPVTEYKMVLRLAEQYLIRAEGRAQLNDVAGAIEDLDRIRARAGLDPYAGAQTSPAVLDAIHKERFTELFSEWGDRWLDLKRTGRVDAVMAGAAAAKGTTWKSYQQYYPVLQSDLEKNVNLEQNEGY